ncbi:B-cell linker protein isoform X2 [Brienomyrus brachyistius]|uniref:B-cell linker protein isoform X2 n=1 Tax=Brienomyrus brachyistius TaxID=42636 RepID=UPI0020B196C8|nr:B-cell linker protein isoform X2 [Brienomyrus brachyistius]
MSTMSFFGKLKSLGPPAPPKRIDNSPAYDWPENEFDEDDCDTYEAPPCERPVMTVTRRPVETNVYIERSSAVVPPRQAPPPHPAKTTPIGKVPKPEPRRDFDEMHVQSARKPPQVNRKEKPGTKIPPARAAPVPVPVPQCEEDLYLDPNEGQEDSDDLYLEPHGACPSSSPNTRTPMWMPTSPKTTSYEAQAPIMKPPVPTTKANAAMPSNVSHPVPVLPPAHEVRPPQPKRPPRIPGLKPPIPSPQKEAKSSMSYSPPPQAAMECHTAVKGSPTAVRPPPISGIEASRLLDMEWFAGNCDRKEAEEVLHTVNKDGAFLVRRSSAQSARQPYTLVVLYHEKVYNIPVRFLEETQSYALGKDGKKSEEFFGSLMDIISHHKNNPIVLIDSKSQTSQTTYLSHAVRP